MTAPLPPPPHHDPTPQTDSFRVTILEHITTLVSTLDRRFDTLHQDLKDSITQRFTDVYVRMADADLRYQQRYDAQQIALKDARESQDKAVAAALSAAEKAVAKAEVASEKRFDAVNEFRGQQADIVSTFIPRSEAEQRFAQSNEKTADLSTRLSELGARIDRSEGRTGGHADSTRNLVTIVGIALTAITVIVGVYLAFKG